MSPGGIVGRQPTAPVDAIRRQAHNRPSTPPRPPVHVPADSLLASLSAPALEAPESGIVAVFNYGRLKEGLIPLWVGEGDLPTPAFISEAATRALAAGETFYTYQRGIPPLREALAAYHARLFGKPFSAERFFVTTGGMQAVQIAMRMIAEPGAEVLVPTPIWPNLAAAVGLAGGTPVSVPMDFSADGWRLDVARLAAAIVPGRTRGILINSPANPTGWTAGLETLEAILDLSRRHGLWIVADEVYGRFTYGDAPRAPSFHDIADPDDRILYVNTLSKNWAMTGWRVGWLEAPPILGQVIENLVQYSTSGVPAFLQRGAVAALEHGESFVAYQIERARRGRAALEGALAGLNRVRFAPPTGAFYLFLGIDGFDDTLALALRLVDEAGVGVAPGATFGTGGEPFVRLCFARDETQVATAGARLADWIRTL